MSIHNYRSGFWSIMTVRGSLFQTIFENNWYAVLKYIYDLKIKNSLFLCLSTIIGVVFGVL